MCILNSALERLIFVHTFFVHFHSDDNYMYFHFLIFYNQLISIKLVSGVNNLQIVYNLLRVITCKTLIMELAYVGSTTLNCVRMQTELLSIFEQHSYLEKKNEN